MTESTTGKSIFKSKTLWANLIAVLAMFAQNSYGVAIEPETQVSILAVVNVVLRLVTKEPVVWE